MLVVKTLVVRTEFGLAALGDGLKYIVGMKSQIIAGCDHVGRRLTLRGEGHGVPRNAQIIAQPGVGFIMLAFLQPREDSGGQRSADGHLISDK